ncbi:Maturase K [Frankliniella fusca]|uniref:Maturase K n=1 Tax=Frankliniella fusca TaxID=407009 RepID=A0AAE1HU85_9NEOP|nr:Maturase K [Frankliniella fusca]
MPVQEQELGEHAEQAGHAELWGEWLASRRAGQIVIRSVDSVLRLIEKSLMWSTQSSVKACPRANAKDGANSGDVSACVGGPIDHVVVSNPDIVVVARPLSWPLFLPLVGVLGVVRVTVYFVSRIIRRPCDTIDMIHWLQSKRRRLRFIKFAGLKNIRAQAEANSGCTPNGTPVPKKTLPASTTPDHERKRKYCDVEQSDWTDGSDDETVAVKLDKYGKDYDSECDPDFVPSSDEDSSDDEGSVASGEEDLEGGAVLVNGTDVPTADAVSSPTPVTAPASPAHSPSITVETPEPVSEYASTDAESASSPGGSVTSPLSPKSKFVKFFRRGSKTKQ